MERKYRARTHSKSPPKKRVQFTPQQRFLWHRPGGEDGLHVRFPFPFLLVGSVDVELVRTCVTSLVRKNDALGMRIALVSGEPCQIFAGPSEDQFEVADISDPDKHDSDLDARVREEILERFEKQLDLEVDLLFKVTLFKLTNDRKVLVFWAHHILFDGYALPLLYQSFWNTYDRFINKKPDDESDPMQFSEYCAWQESFRRSAAEKCGTYWTAHLHDASGVVWPDVENGRLCAGGATQTAGLALDESCTANLRRQARRSGIHLASYGMAAYATVLRKWCNQSDVTLATTIMGRPRREHLGVIGYLVQPIYLRIQSALDCAFDDVLRALNREYFSAVSHMDFGDAFLRDPELSSGTLFQWFPAQWNALPPESLNLGFHVERFQVSHKFFFHEKFKLGISIADSGDQLTVGAMFRPDYFQPIVVERLLGDIARELTYASTSVG